MHYESMNGCTIRNRSQVGDAKASSVTTCGARQRREAPHAGVTLTILRLSDFHIDFRGMDIPDMVTDVLVVVKVLLDKLAQPTYSIDYIGVGNESVRSTQSFLQLMLSFYTATSKRSNFAGPSLDRGDVLRRAPLEFG